MIGIASENALKERFSFVVAMGVESDLAKLIVRFGLLGLEADGGFELALSIFGAQERSIDISETVVRGRIVGAGSQVGLVVALGLGHLLLLGFETRDRIENGGVFRSQFLRGVQSFVGFGKLAEFECLQAAVELDVGCVGKLFAGMSQCGERAIRAVVATAVDGEFGGGGHFSFAGSNMARVLCEDGFEAIHGFGVAMLREQYLAEGQVGRDGVGACAEGASEAAASVFSLMKVEQRIAKKDESGGIVPMLLGVWAEKRSGLGGLVL